MNNRRGSILAIVVIFIFIFTLLGMFAMRLVVLQNETSDSELYYTRAHFAALYGSELALNRIMQWENIATSSTYLNTDGRKFLAKNSNCFSYSSAKWFPLTGWSSASEENFSDEITGGAGSGIAIDCFVEEDLFPNVNDGKIPDTNPSSLDQRYATYKFYVIRTTATIYKDLSGRTGEISQARDLMYFFIAYSSGTEGARPLNTIAATPLYPQILGLTSAPGFVVNVSTTNSPYIVSAPSRSIVTGSVVPIFRYYIRGRR